MEAAGIEPASEINSPIAPTCFSPDLILAPGTALGVGCSRCSPGDLGPASRATRGAQPQSMPIFPALRRRPGRSWRLILVRQPLHKNWILLHFCFPGSDLRGQPGSSACDFQLIRSRRDLYAPTGRLNLGLNIPLGKARGKPLTDPQRRRCGLRVGKRELIPKNARNPPRFRLPSIHSLF